MSKKRWKRLARIGSDGHEIEGLRPYKVLINGSPFILTEDLEGI